MRIKHGNNLGIAHWVTWSNFFGFFEGFVDGADHVKRLLRQMITLACNNHLETTNGFRQADVLAGRAGKHLRNMERLAETIRGFKMIVAGECDHLPEQAFYMVGTIDEAFEKAKKV